MSIVLDIAELKESEPMYTICRCIALDNVADFTLTSEPTADEYKLLAEKGFVQYEPDDIDGMYHFSREEYLV